MDNNSFDRLVSGLSSGERKDMLDKMKAAGGENESLVSDDKYEQADSTPFAEQIKTESLLYRIFLWLRAVLANTSMEALYNEHKISLIAKWIDKNFPNLVDYKRNVLLTVFYQKLVELKSCADFFRPYIAAAEEKENDFLVFLGSLAMTEVEKKMDENVDPYSIPLDQGPKPEQRMQLLRKLEEVLGTISSEEKGLMYANVRAFEWLKQFTKLPFSRFISLFSSASENTYTCSYRTLENEISLFSKVLCNGLRIPEEVFEALFLFTQRNVRERSLDSVDQISEKAAEFMEKSKSQVALMRMFITSVPMRSLGRVIYSDANWNPENFTGGEDWYKKYRENWRKLFDAKWEAWSKDCKKELIRQSLSRNFGLEEFPLLPERPWKDMWGGLQFKYELTAGFLSWYMKEQFTNIELCLKTVMLEGDFVDKENRQEYNDSFNKLIQLSIQLHSLTRQLSTGGEYGVLFQKLMDERLRSLQAYSKVESIIRSIESDVRSMLVAFGDACRVIELCFTGIFHEKTDSRYDGLTNLQRLSGHENEKFQNDLKYARQSLTNAFSLVKELEPVDTPMVSAK